MQHASHGKAPKLLYDAPAPSTAHPNSADLPRRDPRDPRVRLGPRDTRCLQAVRHPITHKPQHTHTNKPPSAALKHHPDRVPDASPDREARTRKFQLVNDAYYTLSDSTRRRDYDIERRRHPPPRTEKPPAEEPEPEAEFGAAPPPGGGAQNAYSWAWNFFTGQGQAQGQGQSREQAESEQFGDVFEEMLREQGMADGGGRPAGSFWSFVGGASGGALGFIIGNVPGLVAGAVAGNRLGAVRDAKGKSVYAVFLVSYNHSLALRVALLTWRRSCLRMLGRDFLASSLGRYLAMRRAYKVRAEAMVLANLAFPLFGWSVWRYPCLHNRTPCSTIKSTLLACLPPAFGSIDYIESSCSRRDPSTVYPHSYRTAR